MLKYILIFILSANYAISQPINCPGNSCKPTVIEVPSTSALNSQVNNAPVRSVTRNISIYSFATSNHVSDNAISIT